MTMLLNPCPLPSPIGNAFGRLGAGQVLFDNDAQKQIVALAPAPTPTVTTPSTPLGQVDINRALWRAPDFAGMIELKQRYPAPPLLRPTYVQERRALTGVETGVVFNSEPAPKSGASQLETDNYNFSSALIAELTNADVLFVLGTLGRAKGSEGDPDTPDKNRASLRAKINELFNDAGASLADFFRVALAGGVPLNEGNASAEILGAVKGADQKIPFATWLENWSFEAVRWLERRQALAWPVVVEILAGLPTKEISVTPLVIPSPSLDELRAAFSALDYLDHGVIPQVYGRGKPAIVSAVAVTQQWLRSQESVGHPQRAHWAWVLQRFGYEAPTPPTSALQYQSGMYGLGGTKETQLDLSIAPNARAFSIEGARVPPALVAYALDGWRETMLQNNRVATYAGVVSLPAERIDDLVGEYGIKSTLSLQDKRIALAETWASLATENNVALMVQVSRDAIRDGLAIENTYAAIRTAAATLGTGQAKKWRHIVRGTGGVRGAGASFFEKLSKGFKKLVTHPVKWFNSLREETGKLLQAIGREVERWGRVPILGDFFLAPLGITFTMGTVLKNLGNVLVDGAITSFDEKEVGLSFSRVLTSAGRALLVAAPFLPAPFNLLAGLVGALSLTAGMAVSALLTANDCKKAIDQYNEAQQTQFAAQVEAAQRQAEAEQAQAIELQKQNQEAAQAGLLQWLDKEGLLSDAFYSRAQDVDQVEEKPKSRAVVAAVVGGVVLTAAAIVALVALGAGKKRKAKRG